MRPVRDGRTGLSRRRAGRSRRDAGVSAHRIARMSVLVVDSGDRGNSSFYLSKALQIGTAPQFQVETMPASRVAPNSLDGRTVVVLNDSVVPPALGGAAQSHQWMLVSFA